MVQRSSDSGLTLSCFSDVENQRRMALGILYHLSVDDKVKSMFTYTDCIPIVSTWLTAVGTKFYSFALQALAELYFLPEIWV